MKILFNVQSDDSEYNADCDYAVLDMTPTLWKQVHRRVEVGRHAIQADDDLYELCFWGGTADFYSGLLIEACQEAVAAAVEGSEEEKSAAAWAWLARLDDPGYALLPSGVDLEKFQPERTECDQMIVRGTLSRGEPAFEIAWTAIPKHTDIQVTTRDLPLSALDTLVRDNSPSTQEMRQ
jgi:hypothetical protein